MLSRCRSLRLCNKIHVVKSVLNSNNNSNNNNYYFNDDNNSFYETNSK